MTTTEGNGPSDADGIDDIVSALLGSAMVSVALPPPPRGAGATLASHVDRLATRTVCDCPAERRMNPDFRKDLHAYGARLGEILDELNWLGQPVGIPDPDAMGRLQRASHALDLLVTRGRGKLGTGDRDSRMLETRLDGRLGGFAPEGLAAIVVAARSLETLDTTSQGRLFDVIGTRAESLLLGERAIDDALRKFLAETSGHGSRGETAAAAAYESVKRAPPPMGIAAARRTGLLNADSSAGLIKEGLARFGAGDNGSLQRLLKRVPTRELNDLLSVASPHGYNVTAVDIGLHEELRRRFAWLATAGGGVSFATDTSAGCTVDGLAKLRRLAGKLASAPDRTAVAILNALPRSALVCLPDELIGFGLDAKAVRRICARLADAFDQNVSEERIRGAVQAAADEPTIARVLDAAAASDDAIQISAKLGNVDLSTSRASVERAIGRAFSSLAPPEGKRLAEFLGGREIGALLQMSQSPAGAPFASSSAGVLASLGMLRVAANVDPSADRVAKDAVDPVAPDAGHALADSLAIHAHLGITLGPLVSASAQKDYALAIERLPSEPSGTDPRVEHAFEAGLATTSYVIGGSSATAESAKAALVRLTGDNGIQARAVSRVANRRTLSAIETCLVVGGKGIRLADGRAVCVSGYGTARFDVRKNDYGEIIVAAIADHARIASRYCDGSPNASILKPIADTNAPPIRVVPGCEIRYSVGFSVDKYGETRISRLPAVETRNLREVTPQMTASLRTRFAAAIDLHTSISEERMSEFAVFCATQFASKNIEFWEGVEILADSPDTGAAHALYDTYLADWAESPVNLTAPVRRRLNQTFIDAAAKVTIGGNAEELVAVFRPAQRAVVKVLATVLWPRFQKSISPR